MSVLDQIWFFFVKGTVIHFFDSFWFYAFASDPLQFYLDIYWYFFESFDVFTCSLIWDISFFFANLYYTVLRSSLLLYGFLFLWTYHYNDEHITFCSLIKFFQIFTFADTIFVNLDTFPIWTFRLTFWNFAVFKFFKFCCSQIFQQREIEKLEMISETSS